MLTPFHHGLDKADLSNALCTQCNACQEICPVDIPLPRQILEHRRHGRKSVRKKALLAIWERPALADAALRAGAPFSNQVARTPYRDSAPAPTGRGEPLTIFASCMGDRMLPEPTRALERIARSAGFDVGFPKGQWCCGLVAGNAGNFEEATQLNEALLSSLRDSKGPIVTPSASCFGAVTLDAATWGARADSETAGRLRDSTRFVLELLQSRPELIRRVERGTRVAYHDSCQSLRQLGLKAEPRQLLELAGYEPVDIPDIANCCGFGGTFSLEWPQVAARLAGWKLDAIARTGCEIVASDNPGCLMHIASAARRRHQGVRIVHVLELVAERLA